MSIPNRHVQTKTIKIKPWSKQFSSAEKQVEFYWPTSRLALVFFALPLDLSRKQCELMNFSWKWRKLNFWLRQSFRHKRASAFAFVFKYCFNFFDSTYWIKAILSEIQIKTSVQHILYKSMATSLEVLLCLQNSGVFRTVDIDSIHLSLKRVFLS